MLTSGEVDLCSRLRILPKAYMVIKDTILREAAAIEAAGGVLRRRKARQMIKIDVNKTGKIYDYFLGAGWIKGPSR